MKARNTLLLLVIAIGLYACGGGSGSSMSSTAPTSMSPTSSAPPPSVPPASAVDYTPESVAALTSASDETTDPTTFDHGATMTPSDDQTSDPMRLNGL